MSNFEVRHACPHCGSTSTPRTGSVGRVIYRGCAECNAPTAKVVRYLSTEISGIILENGDVVYLRDRKVS